MKDYRITVRFPAKLRQRLKAAARRAGTRESDFVRGAVEGQLAIEEDVLSAYEHAKKIGLIGAARGASRDLQYESKTFQWVSAVHDCSRTDRHRSDRSYLIGIRRTSQSVRRAASSHTSPLLICWPVITEAAWLLRAYPLAIGRLLSSFSCRPFELASLGETDLAGIAAILIKYKGLGIQLADASVVHLANREGIENHIHPRPARS
jgi:predicted DNA-binding protein